MCFGRAGMHRTRALPMMEIRHPNEHDWLPPPQQIDPATQLQMNTIMQLCEEKVGGPSGQLNTFHLI